MSLYKRIKVSNNFHLDEYVDPYTYFTSPDNGLSLVDDRIIKIDQLLRDLYGRGLRINHWWWYYEKHKLEWSIAKIITGIEKSRSTRKWSGIRTDRCGIGSKTSAHKLIHSGKGMASDTVGKGQDLFDIVKANAKAFYDLGLRRLEDPSITPTWLHKDLLEKNTQPNSIRVIDRVKCTETIRW